MSIALSRADRRQAARHLQKEAGKYPRHLIPVPTTEWPERLRSEADRLNVWRSRDYLVQVFREPAPCCARLSILRTSIDSAGDWHQDIPWEDLQRLKSECGFGHLDAVEVYPNDKDVVNVANIRHLFVMADRLEFAWKKS